jgi:elongation factor Ts
LEKASDILYQRGLARAEKKATRLASQGIIEAYIHHGGKLGVLVEVNCESDFVAHTEEFRELAHHLALQIAATSPEYISPEGMPEESIKAEEVCLLAQPFIRDESKTVKEVIAQAIARLGENISVRRFSRFELGG